MSAASSPPPKVHKRAYQACIPCRERRVKCDLGSVDAPRSGPCGRCRRERKNCTFSVTRGKRKAAALAAAVATPGAVPNCMAPGSAAAALAHVDPSVNVEGPQRHASLPEISFRHGTAITPSLSEPGTRPLTGIGPSASSNSRFSGLHQRSKTTEPGRSFSTASKSGDNASSTLLSAAFTSHDALSLLWEAGRQGEKRRADELKASHSSIPNASLGTPESLPAAPQTISTEKALQIWSKLRFVRSGLFTAEEALEMVTYFHTNLAPFTPISSSPFQDPATHETLLDEEPILAATILMLSSRYMKFTGRGAVSRGYLVHDQLWRHLQDMISRMIFGQEQFKASHMPDSDNSTPQLFGSSVHLGGLRTLGTCEALLLLSEWHPRALHVPAFEDRDGLLVRDDERATKTTTFSKRIQVDWLEPAWRSDRMCWSMLGNALSLAVELGIFDEYDNTMLGAREARKDIWSSETSRQRAYRVQNLLWVYLTQTSGRLGWKNMTSVSLMDLGGSGNHGDTIRCWVTVASLMKRGNESLFQSRELTREIIRSGEYLRFLEMLNPLLTEWQRDFERAKLSFPMRSILSIEYSYVRVYVNSVALQAVVEHRDRTADPDHAMPVATMLNPYEDNKEYFLMVVNAAREILQTVVNDLYPNDSLKHVPIRTYSRIVAGAMFCLKSVALSNNDAENAISLDLVERTAHALCSCVVDDVHLSNRFGELLHALVLTIRAESSSSETNSCRAAAQPHPQARPQPDSYLNLMQYSEESQRNGQSDVNLGLSSAAHSAGVGVTGTGVAMPSISTPHERSLLNPVGLGAHRNSAPPTAAAASSSAPVMLAEKTGSQSPRAREEHSDGRLTGLQNRNTAAQALRHPQHTPSQQSHPHLQHAYAVPHPGTPAPAVPISPQLLYQPNAGGAPLDQGPTSHQQRPQHAQHSSFGAQPDESTASSSHYLASLLARTSNSSLGVGASAASTGTSGAGTQVDHSLQHDPLMNFAGLGAVQLGWSGGQDFFDLMGPLLDVQFETR